jgi:hypothetical protein
MGMGGWQWCGEAEAMKHEGGEIMGGGCASRDHGRGRGGKVVTEGAGLGRRVWAEGGGTVKMKSRVMG